MPTPRKKHALPPQDAERLVTSFAKRISEIEVNVIEKGSMARANGPIIQTERLEDCAPELVEKLTTAIMRTVSQAPIPPLNVLSREYLGLKIIDDATTIIHANMPENGFTDFEPAHSAIIDKLEHNRSYLDHLKSYATLTALAFEPVGFDQHAYKVPSQYGRLKVTAHHVETGEEIEDIGMDEVQLNNGVELGPTQEANIRMGRMMDYVKSHQSELFLPASEDDFKCHEHETRGRIATTNRPFSCKNENTPERVDEKLTYTLDAKRHLQVISDEHGLPTRSGLSFETPETTEVFNPPMAYAHALLEVINYAIKPRQMPIDMHEIFDAEGMAAEINRSGQLIRTFSKDHPDIVFADATVGHGSSILQAASVPGLNADVLIKQ